MLLGWSALANAEWVHVLPVTRVDDVWYALLGHNTTTEDWEILTIEKKKTGFFAWGMPSNEQSVINILSHVGIKIDDEFLKNNSVKVGDSDPLFVINFTFANKEEQQSIVKKLNVGDSSYDSIRWSKLDAPGTKELISDEIKGIIFNLAPQDEEPVFRQEPMLVEEEKPVTTIMPTGQEKPKSPDATLEVQLRNLKVKLENLAMVLGK